MRRELFYNPALLLRRIADELDNRRRLRRLRGTCAQSLSIGHLDTLELIEMAAAEGARVFYDVGAHVGTWTLLCRALVPDGHVIGFEPLPSHVAEFRRRTQDLREIRLCEFGLGSETKRMPFHPASVSDASSFLPLSRLGRTTYGIQNCAPVELLVRTLDEVISEDRLPLPDLLKLDVQGFELEVLRGARQTLAHVSWVLAEVSFARYYAGQALFAELAGYLGERGFEVFALGHTARACQPLTQFDVLFGRAVTAESIPGG